VSGFFPKRLRIFHFQLNSVTCDLWWRHRLLSFIECFNANILKYNLLFCGLQFSRWLFFFPLPLNYRPVWAANDVPYDVVSGVIAGLQKVYPHFSVMPHGLVQESEDKLQFLVCHETNTIFILNLYDFEIIVVILGWQRVFDKVLAFKLILFFKFDFKFCLKCSQH